MLSGRMNLVRFPEIMNPSVNLHFSFRTIVKNQFKKLIDRNPCMYYIAGGIKTFFLWANRKVLYKYNENFHIYNLSCRHKKWWVGGENRGIKLSFKYIFFFIVV